MKDNIITGLTILSGITTSGANMSYLRILGLISLIGWMICILVVWVLANARGYTYFSAGEPQWWIKYPEWLLGIIGIVTASQYLISELKKIDCHTS